MPQPSIAKVLTRKSKEFRGFGVSRDYIERIEAAGSVRMYNLEIGRDGAKQMDDVWERAGRPKMNPVYHFVRSYIAENLPHEQIWEDFEKSLSEIGWGDRQIIGAIHVDWTHIHVHGVGNRIHPITHEIWRPDGRDKPAHALATGATNLFSLDGQRKIDPRAADFEIHTGQMSMQRWGREIVRPTIEAELRKNTASWGSLIDVLGAQHGVTLEAVISPGKLPENSPLTLVAKNGTKRTTLRLNGVDKNLTRESLTERFNEPFPHDRLPARLNTRKSYVTLREKYLLPTAQMQLPEVAPIYARFIRERASWNAGARTLSRERANEVRARKKAALKTIDDELAEAKKMVRESLHNDREAKLILAAAKIVIAEEKIKIRADAKRRLRTIAEKRPPALFRQWLKHKVAEGDIPAINALTTLRTIGLSRAAEILTQTSPELLRKGLAMNPTEIADPSTSQNPELEPTYPRPKTPADGRAMALTILDEKMRTATSLPAENIPTFRPNGQIAGYKLLPPVNPDDHGILVKYNVTEPPPTTGDPQPPQTEVEHDIVIVSAVAATGPMLRAYEVALGVKDFENVFQIEPEIVRQDSPERDENQTHEIREPDEHEPITEIDGEANRETDDELLETLIAAQEHDPITRLEGKASREAGYELLKTLVDAGTTVTLETPAEYDGHRSVDRYCRLDAYGVIAVFERQPILTDGIQTGVNMVFVKAVTLTPEISDAFDIASGKVEHYQIFGGEPEQENTSDILTVRQQLAPYRAAYDQSMAALTDALKQGRQLQFDQVDEHAFDTHNTLPGFHKQGKIIVQYDFNKVTTAVEKIAVVEIDPDIEKAYEQAILAATELDREDDRLRNPLANEQALRDRKTDGPEDDRVFDDDAQNTQSPQPTRQQPTQTPQQPTTNTRPPEQQKQGFSAGDPRPDPTPETDFEKNVRLRYNQYLRSFYSADPKNKLHEAQDLIWERRNHMLIEAHGETMAGLEAIPPAQRWIVATESMAKLLRAQAKLAEANEIERGVMSRVTGRQGPKTYGAFIDDILKNEKDADERLIALRKRIKREETYETVETTTRKNLEVMKTLQWTVNGGTIDFSLGRRKSAFRDTGEEIITAHGSNENEERAALLIAARKFDNSIKIDGSRAYKQRILRLAVELNIEVTNPELQELRAQLIDKAVRNPPKLPKYPEQPKMRADFEQAFQANITPAERATRLDTVIVAALTQAAKDKGYPNLPIDPDGQKGILQNIVEFNTYAFAIVKHAEGVSMTRVPNTATFELLKLIGTEVNLINNEKQQAQKAKRDKEDSLSRGGYTR